MALYAMLTIICWMICDPSSGNILNTIAVALPIPFGIPKQLQKHFDPAAWDLLVLKSLGSHHCKCGAEPACAPVNG